MNYIYIFDLICSVIRHWVGTSRMIICLFQTDSWPQFIILLLLLKYQSCLTMLFSLPLSQFYWNMVVSINLSFISIIIIISKIQRLVVSKWLKKRENIFGPFSAILIPGKLFDHFLSGVLFSTWPPISAWLPLPTSSTTTQKARKPFRPYCANLVIVCPSYTIW